MCDNSFNYNVDSIFDEMAVFLTLFYFYINFMIRTITVSAPGTRKMFTSLQCAIQNEKNTLLYRNLRLKNQIRPLISAAF